MTEVTAYIGIGSNLGEPQRQVQQALRELAELPLSRLSARSSLYRSAPMGPQDQPDYINAVAALETALQPHDLLDHLQSIEQAHQRVRGEHWGPRTLDLDLLLYGGQQIDSERLQVPHPGLPERNFVLYPLAEVAEDLEVPGLGKLALLLEHCPDSGLQRLEVANEDAGSGRGAPAETRRLH